MCVGVTVGQRPKYRKMNCTQNFQANHLQCALIGVNDILFIPVSLSCVRVQQSLWLAQCCFIVRLSRCSHGCGMCVWMIFFSLSIEKSAPYNFCLEINAFFSCQVSWAWMTVMFLLSMLEQQTCLCVCMWWKWVFPWENCIKKLLLPLTFLLYWIAQNRKKI